MAFDKSADSKPSVAYVGYLAGFGDVKTSAKGYDMLSYTIKGTRGSQGTTGRLLYRTEFFRPDFRRAQIASIFGVDDKGARGIDFVYTNNVYVADGKNGAIAALDAFCGNGTVLDQLSDQFEADGDYSTQGVASTLKSFFSSLGPVEFGYVIRQQRSKQPDGSKVRTAYTEIDNFFRADEKGVSKIVKRAVSRDTWLTEKAQEIMDLRAGGQNASDEEAQLANSDRILIGFDTTDFGVKAPAQEEPSWVTA